VACNVNLASQSTITLKGLSSLAAGSITLDGSSGDFALDSTSTNALKFTLKAGKQRLKGQVFTLAVQVVNPST
jgi:hypothetical protein